MPADRRRDVLCVLGLTALTVAYGMAYLNSSMHPHPSEDAAILMRYSEHLAQGYGIVWNVGDKPVDGATDFLFMVFLAGLVKAGLSVERAAHLVGLLSHAATVALVYLAATGLHGSRPWVGLVSAGYLTIGPAPRYIATCFGTPFFALSACVTWFLASSLSRKKASLGRSIAFAFSALIMGLIRPEGVLLATLMLLSIVYVKGLAGSRTLILCFVGTFALVGGAYFIWRWDYFGYPLPNPYYKKGGGNFYLAGLLCSVENAFKMTFPFALTYVLALRSRQATRQAIFSFIPVAGFTAIWLLLSDEMNYLGRFQYPIVPIVLMSWPALLRGVGQEWKLPPLCALPARGRMALVSLLVIIVAGVMVYQVRRYSAPMYYQDGRYAVALILREYADSGYTLATTEAGLLPLYSRWRTVDTWGLNDQWIAHHGGITASYLEEQHPEVIMLHAAFSPLARAEDHGRWSAMVVTLREFAEANGYFLAGAFGETPYRTHHYYVRSDFPESQDIARRIQRMDYTWYTSGRRAINYATVTQPER